MNSTPDQINDLTQRIEYLENLITKLINKTKITPEIKEKLDKVEQYFSPDFREFCQR